MPGRKLSVVIITKNEEENIGGCLESIKWADEIILVDDYSLDKTVEIARNYTQKIYLHPLETLGRQKQYALGKATRDWILSLDADERITVPLRKEILKKIQFDQFAAYHTYFRPVFLGKEFKRANVRVQGTVRLFRRGKGKFANFPIHERIIIKGKIGVLENEILHQSHRTISQTLEKFNRFSTLEAELLFRAGGRTNLFYTVAAPLNIFLRHFLLEWYFLEGIYGFIYSLLYAYYYFIKHLKIWELALHKKYGD